MSTDRYVSPLSERYASKEMQFIFSPDMKFQTWRKLWIALAETEKELGLKDADGNPRITDEQIEELKAHVTDINQDVAKAREKEVRHDVMSHVYAYGKQCPKAVKGPTCRQPVDRHAGKSSDPDSTALDPVDLIHLLLYFLEIAYYFSYIA